MKIKHTLPSGTLAIQHSGRTYIAKAYILCMLLLCLAGCHKQPDQADDRLLHAEAIIHTYPDSALHLLQAIPYPEDFDGLNQGLYALLHTQAECETDIPVPNDSLISIAVDYFSQTPDSLRKAWSCFYAGRVYRDKKEYKQASDFFQQAAEAGEATNNPRLLNLIHYHRGLLFCREQSWQEGLEALTKAKVYAEKAGDKAGVVCAVGEIAWAYREMKDYPKAGRYLEEGIALAKQSDQTNWLSWLYYRLGVLCLEEKQYAEGLESAHKGMAFLLPEDRKLLRDFNKLKGDLFYGLHRYDSAKVYFTKGMDGQDCYALADYHLCMARIEEQQGNFKQALFHHEHYSAYRDSIQSQEDAERLTALRTEYDKVRFKYVAMLTSRATLAQAIANLVVLLAVLLFAVVVVVAYAKKKKEKEEIIQSKNRLLAQSILKLQEKKNELLQTEQHIREKNSELQTYKTQLQTLKLQILKMTEVTRKIENMNKLNPLQKNKKKADLLLSQQDKKDLFEAINFCFDGFETRLRAQYSKLTDEDILLCCLLKMNINNQDIVILLETNDEALKKRKYRIKHDKIADTGNLSLADFLSNY